MGLVTAMAACRPSNEGPAAVADARMSSADEARAPAAGAALSAREAAIEAAACGSGGRCRLFRSVAGPSNDQAVAGSAADGGARTVAAIIRRDVEPDKAFTGSQFEVWLLSGEEPAPRRVQLLASPLDYGPRSAPPSVEFVDSGHLRYVENLPMAGESDAAVADRPREGGSLIEYDIHLEPLYVLRKTVVDKHSDAGPDTTPDYTGLLASRRPCEGFFCLGAGQLGVPSVAMRGTRYGGDEWKQSALGECAFTCNDGSSQAVELKVLASGQDVYIDVYDAALSPENQARRYAVLGVPTSDGLPMLGLDIFMDGRAKGEYAPNYGKRALPRVEMAAVSPTMRRFRIAEALWNSPSAVSIAYVRPGAKPVECRSLLVHVSPEDAACVPYAGALHVVRANEVLNPESPLLR
jgi:hypothetical protein